MLKTQNSERWERAVARQEAAAAAEAEDFEKNATPLQEAEMIAYDHGYPKDHFDYFVDEVSNECYDECDGDEDKADKLFDERIVQAIKEEVGAK